MGGTRWDYTEDDLRRLAGDRSFERAAGYMDAVSEPTVERDGRRATVRATVRGTMAYRVSLTVAPGGAVDGRCGCPFGAEGNFCKHCVAVGLTVLRRGGMAAQATEARAQRDRFDAWLEGLSRQELLAVVRAQVAADPGFRRRLELRVQAFGPDLVALRSGIAAMLDPGPFTRYGFMEYTDVNSYAEQARSVTSVLADLVAEGRAADAVILAREAVERVESLYETADDSSGALGDLVGDLLSAHLRACEAASPDPTELAEWLVAYLLGDYASDAVRLRDYRAVLGPTGLAAAHRLAVEALRRAPKGWAEKDLVKSVRALCAEAGVKVDKG